MTGQEVRIILTSARLVAAHEAAKRWPEFFGPGALAVHFNALDWVIADDLQWDATMSEGSMSNLALQKLIGTEPEVSDVLLASQQLREAYDKIRGEFVAGPLEPYIEHLTLTLDRLHDRLVREKARSG